MNSEITHGRAFCLPLILNCASAQRAPLRVAGTGARERQLASIANCQLSSIRTDRDTRTAGACAGRGREPRASLGERGRRNGAPPPPPPPPNRHPSRCSRATLEGLRLRRSHSASARAADQVPRARIARAHPLAYARPAALNAAHGARAAQEESDRRTSPPYGRSRRPHGRIGACRHGAPSVCAQVCRQ